MNFAKIWIGFHGSAPNTKLFKLLSVFNIMRDYYKLSQFGIRSRWIKSHDPVKFHIQNHHVNYKNEKARLIGFLMGDGSLTSKKGNKKSGHHDIRFYPDDDNMLNIFIKDFEKLYLKKPHIRKLKNYYVVSVSSKPAWDDLNSIANFDSLNWQFPDTLVSKNEKIEWLRAMFDCEAYVYKEKNKICFQTVSKQGINSIKDLLKEFGIESKSYVYHRKNKNWNINYLLFITKKENIFKFKEEIGFNHKAKKIKLQSMPACRSG